MDGEKDGEMDGEKDEEKDGRMIRLSLNQALMRKKYWRIFAHIKKK